MRHGATPWKATPRTTPSRRRAPWRVGRVKLRTTSGSCSSCRGRSPTGSGCGTSMTSSASSWHASSPWARGPSSCPSSCPARSARTTSTSSAASCAGCRRHTGSPSSCATTRFYDDEAVEAATAELLAGAGAEWVSLDTTTLFSTLPPSDAERAARRQKPHLPRRLRALTDRPVARYIGVDDPAATAAGWQRWLPVLAGWLDEGRSPTMFVHTPDNLDAPVLARRLHDEVRARRPDLPPLPEPHRAQPAAEPTLF